MPRLHILTLLLAVALLAACDEQASEEPYLEINGGGFVFNYRLAEANYVLIAGLKRAPSEGTLFEAEFEDPSGGPAIRVRLAYKAARRVYTFESPPVEGIVAGRDYQVVLRVLTPDGAAALAEYRKLYHATLDQSVLPEAPLTVGPGYHRPPGGRAN